VTAANGTTICFVIDHVGFFYGLLIGFKVAKISLLMNCLELVAVNVMNFVVSIDLRDVTYIVVILVPPNGL
jgi:hypothetical protein